MRTHEIEQVREDLRFGTGQILRRRRAIIGLSIFSATVLGGIGLFQVGIVKKLPDPKLPRFDADKVNGSREAYSIFGIPDALLGMASYAATGCLAGMGAKDRWRRVPAVPLALAGKITLDTAMAVRLSVDEWTKFRSFSLWSLLVAGATFASLPLALPEAIRAWKER